MEKVIDTGIDRCILQNIENKIQKQIFMEEGLLTNNRQTKKQEDAIRTSKDDYSAFLEKNTRENKRKYPSVFTTVNIRRLKSLPTLSVYSQFGFPLLGIKTPDLIELSCSMIRNSDFVYPQQDLKNLITEISQGYNIVAYHSFTHGVALMHLLQNCFDADTSLKDLYTAQERGFALIAGLAHDINHPGNTNKYQIKLKSKWAQLAENDAVLQKMHLRYFFQILRNSKEFDLQCHAKKPLLIKQMITRVILGTDFSKHFTKLSKLKNLIEKKELNLNDYNHRYFILQNFFHACDIGYPCFPFKQYMNWTALVIYELNNQAEYQIQQNFGVNNTLLYKGKQDFYPSQISFVSKLVYPLWKELSNNWPGIKKFSNNISINLVKLKLAIETKQENLQQEKFIEI